MGGLNRRQAGQAWERVAEAWLGKRGLSLLQRNFTCRMGEIDLIMADGNTTVFVEVRFRRASGYGSGWETIDRHKQAKLLRAANFYLGTHPARARGPCRFDVLSLDGSRRMPDIRWIPNAFSVD